MDGPDFDELTYLLSRLPGVGRRSARRIILHMLGNKDNIMRPLSDALERAADTIRNCPECHTLDTVAPCRICQNAGRDRKTLCVVENVADQWALERTAAYKGLYHVLGGTLSALDGVTPDQLHIPHLLQRVNDLEINEVIIALNATVEGQTTAHYIADSIKNPAVKLTRLARGVPMGSALDYLDDNTLVTAMNARSDV